MSQLIPSTTPLRAFEYHTERVNAVAVFPDRQRMVTGSRDKMLRLWDLKTGVMLKKMEGHRSEVWSFAISRDGRMIASGDENGEIFAWHGETGEILTRAIKAHTNPILSMDLSPDGTVLATGTSSERTTKLWSTKTWGMQGNPIKCSDWVRCVRYSPTGKLLAIATDINMEIYNPDTRASVANFKGHTGYNFSLAWTPDGTRLLSGGDGRDSTIREWDALTWKQVGNPWTGHTSITNAIGINPAGTLVASASDDNSIRLWRFSDRQTIAIFKHSGSARCVTFSMDGKHILSGGDDKKVSEWAVPEYALPKEQVQGSVSKILAISTAARSACITGDLATAEQILTQEIDANANNYISYANRSFVMARKLDWDHALQDAIKSVRIKPSLIGFMSRGIAMCGKGQIRDARKAFDLAFTTTNGDSNTNHLLFLIKAIALFNANEHEEAILRVEELAVDFPDTDPLSCRVVEAYFQVQLATIAMDGAHHKEADDHFSAAANASAFFSKSDIHSMYEEFVVLFGWDLKSLWQSSNKYHCLALLRAGRVEALECYRSMMDASDAATKVSLLAWFSTFKEE